MKKYWKIFALALIALVISQGCKKEEDDTREYLTGNIKLDFPTYVQAGFTKTYDVRSMMTLARSDGGTVGYYFIHPKTGLRDTVVLGNGVVVKEKYVVDVPDTLANLNLTFGGFTSDDLYYGKNVAKTFTVVKPGLNGDASLTHFVPYESDELLLDSRDMNIYLVTKVGDTYWMRTNLAWEGSGIAFSECDPMDGVFGRFYNRQEAMEACPEGWTLPTEADWMSLASSMGIKASPLSDISGLAGMIMGDLYFNGDKMWEYWPSVKITDKAHLSLIPVGYASGTEKGKYEFKGYAQYSALWLADIHEGKGVFRYIYHDKDVVYAGSASQTGFYAPVRCVRK